DSNGKISWDIIKDKPTDFAPSSHNHDDRYAKKSIANGSTTAYNGPVYLYNSDSSSLTGVLKITLPKTWSNTMLSFDLVCYDYTSRGKTVYHLSGYNYSTNTS